MATLAHNTVNDTRLTDLNTQLRELGRESVGSALAKPKMALAVIRAAADGVIGEDDAEAVYEQYLAGRDYVIQRNTMAAGQEDNSNSKKANTSKVRSQIKAACLPKVDFVGTVDRLIDRRRELIGGDHKIKDMYQAVTDAAVTQLRAPDVDLTDADIDAVLIKPEKADKTELDRMVDEYKRLYKLVNGTKDEPGIPACEPSMRAMADAISAAGGELPPMTKDEKKAAEAAAFLTKYRASTLIPAHAA